MSDQNRPPSENFDQPADYASPKRPIEATVEPYDSETRIQPISDDELEYYIGQKEEGKSKGRKTKRRRKKPEDELSDKTEDTSDENDNSNSNYKETRFPLYFIVNSWKYIVALLVLLILTVVLVIAGFQSENPGDILPVAALFLCIGYPVIAFLLYRQRYLYQNTIYTATYHRLSECVIPNRWLFVTARTQDWSIAMIHEKIKVSQSMLEQQLQLDSWTMRIMVYDPDTNKYEERELLRFMRDGLRLRDVLLGVQKNTAEETSA